MEFSMWQRSVEEKAGRTGELEYWSAGGMERNERRLFITPSLRHSNAPPEKDIALIGFRAIMTTVVGA
jgi:hypothetical protein